MFKKLKQLSGYQWFLLIFCVCTCLFSISMVLTLNARISGGGSRSRNVSACDAYGHSNLVFHEASPEHLYSDGYSVDCWECSVCHRFFTNESCSLEVSAFLPATYPGCLSIQSLLSDGYTGLSTTSVGVVVSRYERSDERFLMVSDLREPVAVKVGFDDYIYGCTFVEGDVVKINGTLKNYTLDYGSEYTSDFKTGVSVEKVSSVNLNELFGSCLQYSYYFGDETISSDYSYYYSNAITISSDAQYQAIVNNPSFYAHKLIRFTAPYICWSTAGGTTPSTLRFGPSSSRLSSSSSFIDEMDGTAKRFFVFSRAYLSICFPSAIDDNVLFGMQIPYLSSPEMAECDVFCYLSYNYKYNQSLDFVIVAVDDSGYDM